jgi:CxxC motif-containing protein (DUF1111 family)
MRVFLVFLAVALLLLALTLRGGFTSAGEDADVTAAFGEPIPGLDAFERARVERGREVFTRRFSRADGLGPHFNAVSCTSCHETPAAGGSAQRYRDFFLVGRTEPDGSVRKVYPDCTEANRSTQRTECCLPSLVLPTYGPKGTLADPVATNVEHPRVPPDADVVARRNAPPLFGVGLFRLVDDAEILSRADPGDADGDGVSGRPNFIASERGALGRFGYKCQTASIEGFNRGALHNQMGLTSDSTEDAIGDARPEWPAGLLDGLLGTQTVHAQVAEPRDRIVDFDEVPDPEIKRGQLQDLIFFQEHLAAPRRGAVTPAVRRGADHFARIGCASCHVPSLSTPLGLIHPYTDLLLHDLGPELADGVAMAQAGPSEFRTQPLWGLCEHAPFLHDGRADTVEEAILQHGGEAERARQGYEALRAGAKADFHAFLESL